MAEGSGTAHASIAGRPDGPLHLTTADPSSMMQIGFWPDTAAAVQARMAALFELDRPPAPGRFATKDGTICARIAFDSYLLIDADAAAVTNDLPPDDCAVTDLSHSRRGIAIEGRAAAAFLNRDVAVDFASGACPPGSVVQTTMHHVPVLLLRHAENRFALYVYRSYAEDLIDWLADMARSFADTPGHADA